MSGTPYIVRETATPVPKRYTFGTGKSYPGGRPRTSTCFLSVNNLSDNGILGISFDGVNYMQISGGQSYGDAIETGCVYVKSIISDEKGKVNKSKVEFQFNALIKSNWYRE